MSKGFVNGSNIADCSKILLALNDLPFPISPPCSQAWTEPHLHGHFAHCRWQIGKRHLHTKPILCVDFDLNRPRTDSPERRGQLQQQRFVWFEFWLDLKKTQKYKNTIRFKNTTKKLDWVPPLDISRFLTTINVQMQIRFNKSDKRTCFQEHL